MRRKKQRRSRKQPMGTMDRILVVLAVFLLFFIATMVVLFVRYQSIPDTLCNCVFAACGAEGGIMGWIKTTKEKRQDRRWARQDAAEARRQSGGDIGGTT